MFRPVAGNVGFYTHLDRIHPSIVIGVDQNHIDKEGKAPTKDNLLVFYIEDRAEWEQQCKKMTDAGFTKVDSYNPYWDKQGNTFEDIDGYRVDLQDSGWDK